MGPGPAGAPTAPPPVSRRIRLDTITSHPGPWRSLREDASDARIGYFRRDEEADSAAKQGRMRVHGRQERALLRNVLGAKDARFTAAEKHSDMVWLHLVEALQTHFANESDYFEDLFKFIDSALECPEEANDLLFVTLEHLIKPGSDARAWLDSSGREFPSDGKRALLETSRRLDYQTEPLDALKNLIDHRFEANVDPDAGIRKFNEFVADAAHQLGVPLKPDVVKKHFLASLDSDFFAAMRAEYRRVDQRHSVDILDMQSRLREEFKRSSPRTTRRRPL
ncbi:hypothetical protein CYMTET_3786 [Cymbomonas tetramitiformis]|uniref:Uncharacterized protein n=1 Tax=Cymbomonas tetramitiformis TaxID=36881 RepID=A0AAE0H2P3_9CHLO|nr:hypothetical protein CYMTET_3786 [Cymbomonas tetramitiformis]